MVPSPLLLRHFALLGLSPIRFCVLFCAYSGCSIHTCMSSLTSLSLAVSALAVFLSFRILDRSTSTACTSNVSTHWLGMWGLHWLLSVYWEFFSASIRRFLGVHYYLPLPRSAARRPAPTAVTPPTAADGWRTGVLEHGG